MTRETWYVLEDDSVADPLEVAPDDAGVLRHKSGAAVALGPYGPRSRGVDADVERAKPQAGAGKKPKDMKPEGGKPGYNTRESKAD